MPDDRRRCNVDGAVAPDFDATRKIDTAEELTDGRALIIIKLASGAADVALTSDAMAVYRSVGPLGVFLETARGP